MTLNFKKITLHNFACYQDAEVDLTDKGFCMVSGRNNYKKDNSYSNGSGKSFLWSAICYALTGETIGGLKSGLVNINASDDDSYVSIEFSADLTNYKITRILAPKSDMKIIRNDVDESGKGIRESEKKLGELLPDLNKNLIASTIIIGQGMPNKFSSFSPSGRKELLEKLTKSDFMIEDIKNRIANRLVELNKTLRGYDDDILVNNTKLNSLISTRDRVQHEIETYPVIDYTTAIEAQQTEVSKYENALADMQAQLKDVNKNIEQTNAEILNQTTAKADEQQEMIKKFNEKYTIISTSKTETSMKIDQLKKEIKDAESVREFCPTCGQRISSVIKKDMTNQKKQLADLTEELKHINTELDACSAKRDNYTEVIKAKYEDTLKALREKSWSYTSKQSDLNTNIWKTTNLFNAANEKLTKLKYDRDNHDSTLAALKETLTNTNIEINTLENSTKLLVAGKTETEAHIAVVKKMETLAKRDFRGYLLTDIIKYLDAKSKEYCEIVFGTNELNVYLDGNALDISYCGKMFDNLSGGEKQRVDLILQFAIRDMMSVYLNYSSNILVLDEITDFLDKKSCDAVLSLITEKLTDVESLFIISHHADELNIPIDSEIHIIKDENGISSIA